MKSILLVHPPTWSERDSQELLVELNGPVRLATGRTTALVPDNDIVLFVLGEEYEPDLYRTVGECARAHGIDLEYSYAENLVAKINMLLTGEGPHEKEERPFRAKRRSSDIGVEERADQDGRCRSSAQVRSRGAKKARN